VARKTEEQRLARRTPAETKLPTSIGELKDQNVRLRVGKAFLSYLKACPHVRGGGAIVTDVEVKKLPYGVCAKFAKTLAVFKNIPRQVATKRVRSCLHQYQKYGGRYLGEAGVSASQKSMHNKRVIKNHKRKRGHGGGRRYTCPLVRQQLFDWWTDMRLSIDYKKIGPRFPQKLLVAKWVSLLQDYAAICLEAGAPVDIPQAITPHMVESFEDEFSLTLRKPNRRYKVARSVLAERLELYWTSLLRVRQLALLELGYDPAMQNFDQSPFHRNEGGS
jgi:hypothetical protein